RENRADNLIPLADGQPVRFGRDAERCVVLDSQGRASIALVSEVGEDAVLVHDEKRADPGLAFTLSRLARGPFEPTPIGVFRAVNRAEYAEATSQQLAAAVEEKGVGDLEALLHSGSTWEA